METEKHYFKVGVFCLVAAAAFVFFLIAFRGKDASHDTLRYAIYFDGNVSGLSEGAPIRFKGVKVGEVHELRFVSQQDDRILVLADISEYAPMREDTVASVAFLGIAGTAFISLENTRPDQPPVYLKKSRGEKYPVIASRPSALQEVMAGAPELMGSVRDMVAQMQKLVSDSNIAATQSVLAEATTTLREFKMLARTLREDPSVILRGSNYEGYKVKEK